MQPHNINCERKKVKIMISKRILNNSLIESKSHSNVSKIDKETVTHPEMTLFFFKREVPFTVAVQLSRLTGMHRSSENVSCVF